MSLCTNPKALCELSRRWALATATIPAHCGVPKLVPPMLYQLTPVCPGGITATYWPVLGSALNATSATLRKVCEPRPGTLAVW
jgi:hypothetical protein